MQFKPATPIRFDIGVQGCVCQIWKKGDLSSISNSAQVQLFFWVMGISKEERSGWIARIYIYI